MSILVLSMQQKQALTHTQTHTGVVQLRALSRSGRNRNAVTRWGFLGPMQIPAKWNRHSGAATGQPAGPGGPGSLSLFHILESCCKDL